MSSVLKEVDGCRQRSGRLSPALACSRSQNVSVSGRVLDFYRIIPRFKEREKKQLIM